MSQQVGSTAPDLVKLLERAAIALTHCAQILDVVKGEWRDAWSDWDESVRQEITDYLMIYHSQRGYMNTPDEIRPFQHEYKADAWKQYTPQELGNWIHLLLKRSTHRSDATKRNKDIEDARNYLAMLKAHVDAA